MVTKNDRINTGDVTSTKDHCYNSTVMATHLRYG